MKSYTKAKTYKAYKEAREAVLLAWRAYIKAREEGASEDEVNSLYHASWQAQEHFEKYYGDDFEICFR
jgi:hypothetical protein